MAYLINDKCAGNETLCVDACPADCIYSTRNGANQRLYISVEECLDCGACALACPKSAILSVPGPAHYQQPPRPLSNTVLKVHVKLEPGALVKEEDITVEIPGDKTILNGKVESWAYLMASMAD